VLIRGVGLAAIGVAIGLLAAAPLTSSLRGLLYEVSASDPATYAVVALLLPLVAVAACIIPARRAAGIDPATAMRAE
jgi:putative ABC transport system permease protein